MSNLYPHPEKALHALGTKHTKHQRHEMTENAEEEFEETFRKKQKCHPQNSRVKSVSLWTPHAKGK